MKVALFLIMSFALSSTSFAAAQLVCSAEDGSALSGTVDSNNNVYDLKIKFRTSREFKIIYRGKGIALTTKKIRGSEVVRTLIVTSDKRIVVAVANGIFVDETGSYSIENCEITY